MMILFVALLVFGLKTNSFAFPNFDPIEVQFREFIHEYNRQYESTQEYQNRFEIFKNNLEKIEYFQSVEKGTAKFGITKFADKTHAEMFPRTFTAEELKGSLRQAVSAISVKDIPSNFDWRDHNAVTEVKNQESCRSCWAFSAVGNVEGQYAIKYNNTLSFSNQEVVDCKNQTFGCLIGGYPIEAYAEIKSIGGLQLDSDYPYVNKVQKCNIDYSKIVVQVSDGLVLSTNEDVLAAWLYANGPISIGINAVALPNYIGGIYHPTVESCDPNGIDHGVLFVGYGVETGTPYWIVKNSWGADWGEQGYFRIYRGDGSCGVNTAATSSVVV